MYGMEVAVGALLDCELSVKELFDDLRMKNNALKDIWGAVFPSPVPRKTKPPPPLPRTLMLPEKGTTSLLRLLTLVRLDDQHPGRENNEGQEVE